MLDSVPSSIRPQVALDSAEDLLKAALELLPASSSDWPKQKQQIACQLVNADFTHAQKGHCKEISSSQVKHFMPTIIMS